MPRRDAVEKTQVIAARTHPLELYRQRQGGEGLGPPLKGGSPNPGGLRETIPANTKVGSKVSFGNKGRWAAPPPLKEKALKSYPSTRELIRMAKHGRGELVLELLSAYTLSETYYRVRRHLFRIPFKRFQVEATAVRNRRSLRALDQWLAENGIPPVLYLRCHLSTWKGRVWFNALRNDAARQVWETWLAQQDEVQFLVAARDQHLKDLERVDSTREILLAEIERGVEHLEYVRKLWAQGADDETLAWLERGALPGAYLLTVDSLFSEWCRGGLEESVRAKMNEAWALAHPCTEGAASE